MEISNSIANENVNREFRTLGLKYKRKINTSKNYKIGRLGERRHLEKEEEVSILSKLTRKPHASFLSSRY